VNLMALAIISLHVFVKTCKCGYESSELAGYVQNSFCAYYGHLYLIFLIRCYQKNEGKVREFGSVGCNTFMEIFRCSLSNKWDTKLVDVAATSMIL